MSKRTPAAGVTAGNKSVWRRRFSLLVFAFGALMLTGCDSGKGAASSPNGAQTVINGDLTGCTGDSMRLFRVVGPDLELIKAVKMDNQDGRNSFRIELAHPGPGFYALGDGIRRTGTVVFDQAAEVTVSGNCQNAGATFRFADALVNDEYQSMVARVRQHNQRVQQLIQNLQIFSQTDPQQVPRLQQDLQNQNNTHFGWLDSLEAKGGYIGKLAKLYNFKPFRSDPSHNQYEDEVAYFRGAFFAGLDLKDPQIANTPQIFEKARAYGQTLGSRVLPETAKASIDALMQQAEGSPGYKSIMKGILGGLEAVKSELYLEYGKAFVEKFPQDPQTIAVQNRISAMKRLAVGAEAPEIAENTPQGQQLSLRQLRGQVVLLDFWASWCRPCRMENPNVVKAYNKYHKAGFEILGISLDKAKDKWVQAIAQDGLTWKHISDLGGWGSRPAQTYGVSSIPATFLLDREGKIMARNLRGAALENKLEEIFGF
ncbi:MAG: TlpA disulfide reductase family protein [Bacteroidota bacterium]